MKKEVKFKGLVIPKDAVNREFYVKWIRFRDKLANSPDRHIHTSDPNIIIDCYTFAHHVKAKIRDLPEKERKEIMELYLKYRKRFGLMSGYKYKAYASHARNYGMNFLLKRRGELIGLFGQYFDVKEVHKIVTQDWGCPVAVLALEEYRKQNIKEIEESQRSYQSNLGAVRLGHKRSRLEELSLLYNDRKQKYFNTESKGDYRLLLMTIDQIRREVEGDVLRIDGAFQINVEHKLTQHIQQEILKELVLKDLIVSRVAAKMGSNSLLLMSELDNSFYTKHSGFNGTPDEEAEIIQPSVTEYDFDAIKKKHKKEPVLIEEAEIDTVQDFKQKLLRSIKEKRQQLKENPV